MGLDSSLGLVSDTVHVRFIDNGGYLGMVVQLYVQAHLGYYHILTQKEHSQKLMTQLKSMPLFT